jgi:uncharacterized membrane protein YhaH (DUF805 family)
MKSISKLFKGKIDRRTYFLRSFFPVMIIFGIFLLPFEVVTYLGQYKLLIAPFYVICLAYLVSLNVKRFHDLDVPGAWQVFLLIPLLPFFWLPIALPTLFYSSLGLLTLFLLIAPGVKIKPKA